VTLTQLKRIDKIDLVNINVRERKSYEQIIDPIVITQEKGDAKQAYYGLDGSCH